MFKIPAKRKFTQLVYLLVACMIALSIFSGCAKKPEIIDSKNLRSIIIKPYDTPFSPKVILNSDSMQAVLQKLNDANKEQIKFDVRYLIDVYYKDGKKVSVYCNEEAMKINEQSYKLNENLGDVLK